MNKRTPIQINISNPCSEDWNKMTPDDQGRFCAHCQKKVIDFTTWSDTELFNFFTKYNGHLCGKFNFYQVNRNIHLPPQPHSRLYKYVVALGLTLIGMQTPKANARYRIPFVAENMFIQSDTIQKEHKTSDTSLAITGKVVDVKTKEPIIGALVSIQQNGIPKGGALTDVDGNFNISPVDTGIYDVSVNYIGYNRLTIKNVVVTKNNKANVRAALESTDMTTTGIIVIICNPPLSDPYDPDKTTFNHNDIERMAH